MRELLKGEAASRVFTIDLDKEFVKVSHTVKPNKHHQSSYQMETSFDFQGCSKERLLRLAARSVLIDFQRAWRSAKDRMKAEKWDNQTIMVKDLKVREPADPKAKARKDLDKLDEAARLKVIEEQLAKLGLKIADTE